LTVRSVSGRTPRIHPEAWVDPAALVIGDVELADGVSIWPFTIVRGDEGQYIRIGRNTNVQDGSVVHVTPEVPCIIGEGVTIGHRCVVHACTIGDNVRIGIGAVVLTGAVIEDNAQVGAGAVVPPGKVVPSGTLVMGVPAKPVRQMNEDELEDIRRNAIEYLELWQRDYRGGQSEAVRAAAEGEASP
jgi:carbonic anhydrase/acetyltransferase-like protein (isoleucine patch superfamily)